MNVILLGAGKPISGQKHSALNEIHQGTRVLDWILKSFQEECENIQFVGGYKIDEIASKYPELHFIENKEWDATGATGSLLTAKLPDKGSLLVSYSDILYRNETVNSLINAKGDIVVAVDSYWRERFQGRSEEDLKNSEKAYITDNNVTRLGSDIQPELANAEFVGLVHFRESALNAIKSLKEEDNEGFIKQTNLSGLIEWLRYQGFVITPVDVKGDWAELDDRRDIARFVLGTKAQTLERLQQLVTKSKIEDQVSFTVNIWENKSEKVLSNIQSSFNGNNLVIRSSALSEDGFTTANAGAYTTLLDVPAGDAENLKQSINEVVASYPDQNTENQVLVQPMVSGIKASGVAFTRSLENGAPYYVINYDDITGSTESITSGTSSKHKTLIVRKDASEKSPHIPDCMQGLLPALKEIESLVDYDSLDIEFAVNNQNDVCIFQVRPIAVDHGHWEAEDSKVYALLREAENHYRELKKSSPFLKGSKAVFGIMPDWNPAEIIGTRPGRLAQSLYSCLIMDDIWATQRAEYGYRDVRPQPLLVSFGGHPYVDVRASFNSFVPAEINDELAGKLVDFYLDWLCRHPHLHDKVEFEVVPTCYGLHFDQWKAHLKEKGDFSDQEIDELGAALKEITIDAFGRNEYDLASIKKLNERFHKINISDVSSLEKIWLLLQDCRRYGTLPFSHLARSAFVAVTLLKSAVWKDIISREEMDDFMNSIRTVGHEINDDAKAVADKEMVWKDFIEKYGHLRPGTYDITSESYANDPEKYLQPLVEKARKNRKKEEAKTQPGQLWEAARPRFLEALKDAGLPDEPDYVENFMRKAIEGREYAKFIFTKNLSAALSSIVEFGESHNIGRDQMAHISIDDMLSLRKGEPVVTDIQEWLTNRAAEGKIWQEHAGFIELPPLITSEEDFYVFMYPSSQANYIGSGLARAECVDLSAYDIKGDSPDLEGKVVLIPQADPGYDWLFGQEIAGLITMYGGANSHMAIRSAEFGLPAAIGVGEIEYKRISEATVIELNAGNRQINIIQ